METLSNYFYAIMDWIRTKLEDAGYWCICLLERLGL